MQAAGAPPRVERRFLSTGAAARVAGCHLTTVWRAIDRGELEAFRLGERGHYRIERAALDEWMTQPLTKEAQP